MIKELVEEYNETHGRITIDFDRTSEDEEKFSIESTYVSDHDVANAIKGLVYGLAKNSNKTPLEVIAILQHDVLHEEADMKFHREEDDD